MGTPYKECPVCGAHLDAGELCDCRNELIKKLENMKPDKFYKFIITVLKAYLDHEPCYCRECRKNECCHNCSARMKKGEDHED